MRLLLIGNGYFPYRTAGEKNFFWSLVPRLREALEELIVASFNDHCGLSFQESAAGPVTILNLQRTFHPFRPTRYHGQHNGLRYYHHRHGPLREAMEKQISLLGHLPLLRTIIRQRRIQRIHLMENFGPAMGIMQQLLGLPVSASAIHYQPRGLFYDPYLTLSFAPLDTTVAYTHAYARILQRLGVAPERLTVIPWGVPLPSHWLTPQQKQRRRATLGLPVDTTLFCWSGYLMQIQQADLHLTLQVARQVLASCPQASFLFCLKPEIYQENLQTHATDRLRILRGGEDFLQMLETADYLLSPILAHRSTVAPPLTWLEAIARGIPVITTAIPGTQEVILHRENGLLVANYAELPSLLQAVATGQISHPSPQRVRQTAARFDLQHSLQRYLDLFRK